jgi:hypothetical protein
MPKTLSYRIINANLVILRFNLLLNLLFDNCENIKKWGAQIKSKTLPLISHNFSLSMDESGGPVHPVKVSDLGTMAAL